MTFGIYIGDYFTLASENNAYLEFFIPAAAVSNLQRINPPPGIILPDPRILCCFSEQIRCIEIDGKRLTMISGKIATYGEIKRS